MRVFKDFITSLFFLFYFNIDVSKSIFPYFSIIYLFILFIHVSIHSCIYLFTYWFIHLTIHLFIYVFSYIFFFHVVENSYSTTFFCNTWLIASRVVIINTWVTSDPLKWYRHSYLWDSESVINIHTLNEPWNAKMKPESCEINRGALNWTRRLINAKRTILFKNESLV